MTEGPAGMQAVFAYDDSSRWSASLALSWTPTDADVGDHLVRLRAADTFGRNTVQQFTIMVRRPRRARPDLVIAEVGRANVANDAQTLAVTGRASVRVANQGDGPSPNFSVLVFEDRNRDGEFTPASDPVLGRKPATGLVSGGAATVDVELSGSTLFRDDPLYALVDPDGEVDESREDNNGWSTAGGTRFVRTPGPFRGELKYRWPVVPGPDPTLEVVSPPVIAHLNDDDGDGRAGEGDIPDIVFFAITNSLARVQAIDGRDPSRLLLDFETSPQVDFHGTPAVGDLDGDGFPEILVRDFNFGLAAYSHEGVFLWRNTANPGGLLTWLGGGAAIADMDGDGVGEVVFGRAIINADGSTRCVAPIESQGSQAVGPFSIVADVDLDGAPEVLAGTSAFRNDCSVMWTRPDLQAINYMFGSFVPVTLDCYNAVGQFDDDPYPEIACVGNGKVHLLEHTGETKWSIEPTGIGGLVVDTALGGPPAIADLDGDGTAELVVAGLNALHVIAQDGRIRWSRGISDDKSGIAVTGVTVADLDDDGEREVLFNDAYHLRIYRGSTGETLFEAQSPTGTVSEYPTVADVDRDGHLDVVVATNTLGTGGPAPGDFPGIQVFTSATWRPGRSLWNQYSYHVTNVRCDQRPPAHEPQSWTVHNTYRAAAEVPASVREELGCDDTRPDLTASFLRAEHTACNSSVTYTVRVGNAGQRRAPAGVGVRFLAALGGNPAQEVGVAATTRPLAMGEFEDVSLTVAAPPGDTVQVAAEVDPQSTSADPARANNTHAFALAGCAGDNAAPVFTSAPSLAARVGVPYTYFAVAADADGDPVSIALTSGPEGMALAGAVLLWTPGPAHFRREHEVVLRADDGRGGVATQRFALTVGPPVPPRPPQVEGMHVAVTPDAASVGVGGAVNVRVTLTNVEAAGRTGTLEVDALDAFGGAAAHIATRTPLFTGPGTQTFDLPASLLGLEPGAYTVLARYREGEQEARGSAVITIVDTGALAFDVFAPSAGANEQLTIRSRFRNQSLATSFALAPVVEVLSPAGAVLLAEGLGLVTLVAGANAERLTVFDTGSHPPGVYTVRLTVRQGGVVLGAVTSTFSIASTAEAGTALTGTLEAAPARLSEGVGPVALNGSLTNVGNVDLPRLEVRLRLFQSSTSTVVRERLQALDLARGATETVTASFDTAALPAGAYAATLEALSAGRQLFTASAGVTIVDDVAPVVTITVPACSATDVTPQITVAEPNLASVTTTLDGAPFTGTTVNAEGSHTLHVLAVDTSNNQGSATAGFVIDRTAPQIVVTGVEQGGVYQGVVPEVTFVDANLTQTLLTLDGQPIQGGTAVTTEGHHVLAALARDCAGNTSAVTIEFDVDRTPPAIAVSVAACSAGPVTPVVMVDDAFPGTHTVEVDGAGYLGGAIGVEGPHTLVVNAVDRAGNTATASRDFVVDLTPPQITVGGVADGGAYATATPTVAFADANLAHTTLELDPSLTGRLGSWAAALNEIDHLGSIRPKKA